ncbi:MAG: hypothetical protein KQA35_00430 [Candidatus Aenigmarchaeota archaeon]|nr:hypothetical protein [Candidatus Aenigmarchaeota archaeon]
MNFQSEEDKESLKFYKSSYETVGVLLSSKCIGYNENANIRNEQIKVSTYKILDKSKLDFFSSNFKGFKIPCDNKTEYGIRVKVETFGYNINSEKYGNTKETIQSVVQPEQWEFGINDFSEGDAFSKLITVTSPVIVFYDRDKQVPGKITVEVVSGEMEKLSGFIDSSCSSLGQSKTEMYLHYPTYVERINNKNFICMDFITGKKCQNLVCEKEIEFSKIESKGYYFFESNSQINKVKIKS